MSILKNFFNINKKPTAIRYEYVLMDSFELAKIVARTDYGKEIRFVTKDMRNVPFWAKPLESEMHFVTKTRCAGVNNIMIGQFSGQVKIGNMEDMKPIFRDTVNSWDLSGFIQQYFFNNGVNRVYVIKPVKEY